MTRTKWIICASLQRGQYGFVLKARNGTDGYVSYWFPDRADAVEVKAWLDAGETFDDALANQRRRIDREAARP